MSATGSKAVRLANKVSGSDLEAVLNDIVAEGFKLHVFHSKDLPKSTQEGIWQALEENMKELYANSSTGWHPDDKRAELFHSLSRFIVAHPENESDTLAAYTMFRFEYEQGSDILYCYELQVLESYQRKSLGRLLMKALECIAQKWKMDQIMLTVFKANNRACQFYKAIGFTLDPTSPTEEDVEEFGIVDYEILSKTVTRSV
ncbi:tRNA(Ser) Um(44) 2'-O-methyltransferase [Marasmius crinis-equi]|uniref:N-alpha-acetyltransferase 40 n=1 Tax=Marasmius crinis-equi TaxID=585013 RepID=A0ABR3FXV5_9AGAR